MYPAMLEDIGHSLGVSADSLRRLAIGWLPIVEFKKGKNFQGWIAIAERDSDGVPIGLSLRSNSGMKVMYPSSKHGLIYEVNPEHERGNKGYEAGASNWIRTMDAGIVCPICGKPDGCLLSAENQTDPKAVVCIREKMNAARPMKMGYLHIRKVEGNLSGRSALADNGGPILVVEGMSDAAAAMDLGYNAIGRPSNLACMDMLVDLVRGRQVIVIGENDKKPDGKEPGREGMVAAFQMAKKSATGVTMLMPPEHVKDLRAWIVKYKLTREQLVEYHESNKIEYSEGTVIGDDRPRTIALAFLTSRYKIADRFSVRRWNESWYVFENGKYLELDEESFEQPISPWAYDKFVQKVNATNGSTSLLPLVADNTMISNVTREIRGITLVRGAKTPCWINDEVGANPRDLVVFANGILNVPAFLNGAAESEYFLDLTPDFFTTVALPFSFDPTAECPAWKKFLRTSLGDDQDKIKLLREWLGYCLTPDTSFQKLLYMRGPAGSGKGTVLRALGRLVGKDQFVSTSFGNLCGQFGSEGLVNKLVCIIPDARTPKSADNMRGLELLLNLSGEDAVEIHRKFKSPLSSEQLPLHITIASNEFISVPDHSGAMRRRLLVLDFAKSFADNPDHTLEDKLKAETAGIAIWSLQGLQRLKQQGKFTMPASSVAALHEWHTENSPIAAFIEDCCDVAPGTEVLKQELYDSWVAWSNERKIWQMSSSRFYAQIKVNATYASSETYEKGGHKFSVFRGLTLKKWAARKFLGRP